MRSLSFARFPLFVAGFTAVSALAQAQVFSARMSGFDTGWTAPVGSNYIAANGPATDFVRSGTAASVLGCDTTNITLSSPYSAQDLAAGATGTAIAALTFTNTATTGGGIESVGYRFSLDLLADGSVVAPSLVFDFTLEYGHDAVLGADTVRRIGGGTSQLVTLGGVTYAFALQFRDATGGFLEAEGLRYGVAESTYDSVAGLATWGRGSTSIGLAFYEVGGVAHTSSVTAPAAVPEPATFGLAGAAALLLSTIIFRFRQKSAMRG